MSRLLKLLTFLAGAYVSCQHADGYWVVGPVFGLVVIAWDSEFLRKFVLKKHASYFAVSTLIYALVYRISSQRWQTGESDWAEPLYGPLSIAVIVGSVLLPFAHKFFLKAGDKQIVQTIPLLIFSYYLVVAASFANTQWKLGIDLNFVYVMVVLWQASYLFFLFPDPKK